MSLMVFQVYDIARTDQPHIIGSESKLRGVFRHLEPRAYIRASISSLFNFCSFFTSLFFIHSIKRSTE